MSQRSIFVIEDDDFIRESIRELLEQEGYDVVTATNGREALAYFDPQQTSESKQPCLILLDLMMPVMSGGEFLAALAQLRPEVLRKASVVVLTAAADTFGVRLPVQGLEVVQKPMEIEKIVSIAQRHCGRNECC